MLAMNLSHVSTGSPTYWPSDPNKLPDLIDFCVTKGIPKASIAAESSLDLSSDHTPIRVTLHTNIETSQPHSLLHNKNTNWTLFKTMLCENLNVNLPLKNSEDIEEAIKYLNSSIQNAAWGSTKHQTLKNVPLNAEIEALIKEKRKVRKSWQNTRDPNVKRK